MASDMMLAAAIGAFLGVVIAGFAAFTYLHYKLRSIFGAIGKDPSSLLNANAMDFADAMGRQTPGEVGSGAFPNEMKLDFHHDGLRRACGCPICRRVTDMMPRLSTQAMPHMALAPDDEAAILALAELEAHQIDLRNGCGCRYCKAAMIRIMQAVIALASTEVSEEDRRASQELFRHTIELRRGCKCDRCAPLIAAADVMDAGA